jgi:hypothetical protein
MVKNDDKWVDDSLIKVERHFKNITKEELENNLKEINYHKYLGTSADNIKETSKDCIKEDLKSKNHFFRNFFLATSGSMIFYYIRKLDIRKIFNNDDDNEPKKILAVKK